jgi:HAD superfamily hydrolase (TIGR01509 family)
MFRGAVFDLDGVIVDSHPIHKRAWRAFLATLGKEVSESELDFILEGRGRREILIHFLGDLSEAEVRDYGNRKDSFFRQFSAAPKPVAGSIQLINCLGKTGLRLGVATSASRQRARWTLEQLSIMDHFEVLVAGEEVAQSKPDPAIYKLAAKRLSLPVKSLLAVEDSVCGVRSAKAAGLRCLGIASGANGDQLRAAGADRVFHSVQALCGQGSDQVIRIHKTLLDMNAERR